MVQVIGAGLPRTGTMSTQAALEKLLGGKCYHMKEYAFHGTEEDTVLFNKALRGEATSRDWQEFFPKRGYKSCVDFPTSFFYKELVDAFPDAKVVLTVREPEKWSKSAQLILRGQDVGESFPERVVLMALRAIKKHKLAGDLLIKKPSNNKLTMRGAVEGGEQTSKQFFDAWVEEVKRVVPAERLLIFQVKDGWEPLCKFLDLPVPSEPFPRVNDTEEVKSKFKIMKFVGWGLVLGGPILISALTAATYKCLF